MTLLAKAQWKAASDKEVASLKRNNVNITALLISVRRNLVLGIRQVSPMLRTICIDCTRILDGNVTL